MSLSIVQAFELFKVCFFFRVLNSLLSFFMSQVIFTVGLQSPKSGKHLSLNSSCKNSV